MAKTALVEISSRARAYGRDGVRLIWVVPNFNPDAPVAAHIRDMAAHHRGNVFSLDDAALEASARESKMMLTACVGHRDGTFEPPRLVSLADLIYPTEGLPFLEDLGTSESLVAWEARRAPWVAYFEENIGKPDALFDDMPERAALLAAFHAAEPGPQRPEVDADQLIDLAAILLSVFAEARGKRRVYVTKLANAKALLNTLLGHRPHLARCADLFETMLERSCLDDWRHGTGGRHLERARTLAGETQATAEDVEGRLFRYLIPEIFDGTERARLAGRDALPDWASAGQSAAQVNAGGRHVS